MKFFQLFGIALLATGAGCTTPHSMPELETSELEVKGQVGEGKIGINDDDQVVIREERSVPDELRIQELTNTHLRDKVDGALYHLKSCRKTLARAAGSAAVPPEPELDDLRSPAEVREEMGLDKETGDLKIVRESFLDERLVSERKYETTLRKLLKVAEKHLDECETRRAATAH